MVIVAEVRYRQKFGVETNSDNLAPKPVRLWHEFAKPEPAINSFLSSIPSIAIEGCS
jgi:hypothetical protein